MMSTGAAQPGIQGALNLSSALDSAMDTLAALAQEPGFFVDARAQDRYRAALTSAHELAAQLTDELGALRVRIDQVGRDKERPQTRW